MIPSSWIPEFGETADLLLSSRAMLEPILEEGSEDEGENGLDELWSHYESVWSSESDTGSVIRVDIAQDQDCSSEREFACPPKRPRKHEFDLLEEHPPLRFQPQRSPIISRHQTSFNIKQAIDNQPPLQRTNIHPPKLCDDFFQFSDSDSLSYQSLSRSSSLIQFESLEKQMQNDNNSMFGSSPSLYSQVSLDSKVNKLNIINENIVIATDQDQENNDRVIAVSESSNKNKINSIESLSEDSGYNELQNFIKFKSKSIPVIYTYEGGDQVDGCTTQLHPPYEHFEHTKSLENFLYIEKNINVNEKLRISTSSSSSHSSSSLNENIIGDKCDDYGRKNHHHNHRRNHHHDDDDDNTFSSLYVTKNTNKFSNETKNNKKFQNQNQKLVEAKIFYSYSPIFHKKCGLIFSNSNNNNNNNSYNHSDNNSFSDSRDRDLFQISSLPNNLNNLCALSSSGDDDRSNSDSDDEFCAYRDTNRSSEINSYSGSVNSNSFKPSLTMSYANLTLINDDEEDEANGGLIKPNNKFFKYSNFNHNLSIINDKCDSDYDKLEDIVMDEKPIPPPRRTKSRENLVPRSNVSHSNSKLTFDQDPTNLSTSYTSSLEKCNFNILESITTINLNDSSNESLLDHNYGGVKRKKKFVSSTPNLNYFSTVECRGEGRDDDEHGFRNSKKDDFKSMRQIDNEIKPIGIMVHKNGTTYQSTGSSSKGNLTKGVSFCPIVSEISWKDVHQKSISIEEYINEIDSQLQPHINTEAVPSPPKPMIAAIQQDLNKIEIDRREIDGDFSDEHDHNPYHDNRIQFNDPNIELNLFDTKNLTLSTMLALGNRHTFNNCNNNNGKILYDDDHHEKHMSKIIEILDRIDDDDRESLKNFDLYGGDGEESTECNNNNNLSSVSSSGSSSKNNNSNVDEIIKRDGDINKKQTRAIVDDDHMVGGVTIENKKQKNRNRSNEENNSINSIAVECSNDRGNKKINSQDRIAVNNNSESVSKVQEHLNSKSSTSKKDKNSKKSSKKMDTTNAAADKKAAKATNGGGFLSRFSSFRFSLGRNKNKVKNKINNSTSNINNNSGHNKNNSSDFIINNNNSSNKNNDINKKIVHIPLKTEPEFMNKNFNNEHKSADDQQLLMAKDEIDHQFNAVNNDLMMLNSKNVNETFIINEKLSNNNNNNNNNNNHVLISKPPLPKLPPRVVGVSTKKNNLTHAQYLNQNINTNNNSSSNTNNNNNNNSSNLYYQEHQPQNTISHRSLSIPHVADDNDDNSSVMSEKYIRNSNNKIGLLETDLDTHETIITGKTRSLMELQPNHHHNHKNCVGGVIHVKNNLNKNLISASSSGGPNGDLLMHVNNKNSDGGVIIQSRRPHKSMEFLLDKENHKNILPPENELQKSHESNTLSEHQLRVQASLQRLNIPDWFKNYNSNTSTPTSTQHPHHHHHHIHHQHGNSGGGGDAAGGYTGNFYRKRNSDVGGQPNRWTGLNSKTTSLSSLGSHRSDKSPLMLSPSAHSHHGQTGFSRWSTSHLNSTQTSPSISTRGSFVRGNLNASTISGYSNASSNTTNSSIRSSFRQPYLGWRSQEKLSQPRTPAERLASTLLTKQQEQQQLERERQQQRAAAESQTPENQKHQEEIQSSIKEVTSAIVHYVNDQTNRQTTTRSRSASPNTRKCWLESSFVGNRPLESPQTPVIDNSIHEGNHLDGSGKYSRGVSPIPAFSIQPERPSPGSATLEDVLASLLGLPLDSHRSSENIANENFNYTNYNHNDNMSSNSRLSVDQQSAIRRRSEGDAQQQQKAAHQHHHHHHTCNNHGKSPRTTQQSGSISSTSSSLVNQPLVVVPRRVSLDSCEHTIKQQQQQQQQQKQQTHMQPHQIQSQQFVQSNHGEYLTKCRYPKCDAVATAIDAKKFYKSCHNCSNLYCSRECRRAHWEKHRKACLHSRVSSLCRQVLSTCKDDADSLRHLSLIARKGYISQGRGVVRILFRSPENADSFIKQGFQCIGEAGYVRWADLLPSEMGPELYSELLRLSTEYKPDSKMLVYVAICVVSEAPGSGAAPVKWERQLVSRCAKLKLCRTILANDQLNASNRLTNEQQIQQQSTNVLILTFSTVKKSQKARELISRNIQGILKERGINLRKNFPEVFQRLNSYVDGLTERFLPVTIHPRDNQTGKSFICIIMPNNLENGSNIKMPASDNGNSVQTIDVSLENLVAASSMLS